MKVKTSCGGAAQCRDEDIMRRSLSKIAPLLGFVISGGERCCPNNTDGSNMSSVRP